MTERENMYRWRRMTDSQRQEVLEQRRAKKHPWHNPPHYESDSTTYYLITSACFEHKPVIGQSPTRMLRFEEELLQVLASEACTVYAWNLLPNHYHLLVDTISVKSLLRNLGQLHGRTSFEWNGQENRRGRQVWHNSAETAMKSERHYYASLNYVLHNAAHHGYARTWYEWPYCNAATYVETIGREKTMAIWKSYPVLDYGKAWDPPEL